MTSIPTDKMRHSRAGFSLLEMSIVLIIIATLTGIGVSSGMATLENTRATQTQSKMSQIKRALLAFRTSYARLPCPASLTLVTTSPNFGVQGPNSSACIDAAAGAATASRTSTDTLVVEGAIPTKALNLPDDFAFDGWGNRIRYAVSVSYTANNAFLSIPLNDTCPGVKLLGEAGAANYRTQNAIYTLVSHGANGHGAYGRSGAIKNVNSTNTDEQKNCSCNSTAVATAYTGLYSQRAVYNNPASSTDAFDDIVEYQLRWQLQTAADGESRPATTALSEIGLVDIDHARVRILTYSSGTFRLQPAASISPAITAASNPRFAWTPDRKYAAVVYSSLIDLYKRSGDTLTRVDSFTSTGNGLNNYIVSISSDGNYLAASDGSGLLIFRITCGKISQVTPSQIHVSGQSYSWSPGDSYVVNASLSWLGIVRNTSGTFTAGVSAAPLFPGGKPDWQVFHWSPNTDYAIGDNPNGNTFYRSGTTYVATAVPTITTSHNAMAWSPNNTYVLMGQWGAGGAPDNYLRVMKRTGTGAATAFTLLPLSATNTQPNCGGGPYNAGWSDDSAYFVTMGIGYSCPGINVYKNNNDDTFTWLGAVAPASGDPAYNHAWTGAFSNGF